MPRVPLTELRSRGSQSIDVQMAPGSRLCAGTAVDSAAERVTEGVIGFGEEGATAQAPVRPSAWQRERSFRPRPALPIRRASSGSSQLVSLRAESRRDPPSRRDPRVGRTGVVAALRHAAASHNCVRRGLVARVFARSQEGLLLDPEPQVVFPLLLDALLERLLAIALLLDRLLDVGVALDGLALGLVLGIAAGIVEVLDMGLAGS